MHVFYFLPNRQKQKFFAKGRGFRHVKYKFKRSDIMHILFKKTGQTLIVSLEGELDRIHSQGAVIELCLARGQMHLENGVDIVEASGIDKVDLAADRLFGRCADIYDGAVEVFGQMGQDVGRAEGAGGDPVVAAGMAVLILIGAVAGQSVIFGQEGDAGTAAADLAAESRLQPAVGILDAEAALFHLFDKELRGIELFISQLGVVKDLVTNVIVKADIFFGNGKSLLL